MKSHNQKVRNIKVATFLNISFTIIEIIGGLWTNSLAILSDALHDFGDSIALLTSWLAERMAQKPPDTKRTFGYKRLSLFSALFAALVLVAGSLFILSETIPRLLNPEHVNSRGMAGLAIVGIFFNSIGFLRLTKGASLNERVLSLHLLEDVLGWVVILIGSIIIEFWDNHLIDPIMTIGFTVFILWGVIKKLKETFNVLLQGVPSYINISEIKNALISLTGVSAVHDVHIWSLDGETNIFTAHIVLEKTIMGEAFELREKIKKILENFQIKHSTIEIETEASCLSSPCDTG
ncbi:MAG: cation transporter [Deltaproteobacteria bacterium]|nr:cation transporter [Deltaproteobacteria bacterium]